MARCTKLRQQMISGTSLVAVTCGASMGAWQYLKLNIADVPVAMVLAMSSLCTTGFGVRVGREFDFLKWPFL